MIQFHPSPSFTVGLEMEFQLVDPDSQDLVDGILPLLRECADVPSIKPEFIQNTVEVASSPARNLTELEAVMRPRIARLIQGCDRLGMALCGTGTHPFCHRPAVASPGSRYRGQSRAAGWLGRHQVTFAAHVHLGLPSGEEALRVMRELKPYLPLLIALSAASPSGRATTPASRPSASGFWPPRAPTGLLPTSRTGPRSSTSSPPCARPGCSG